MKIQTLSVRARQARALAAPMVRAVRWPSIIAAGGAAAAIVTLLRAEEMYEPGVALRWTAVLVSLGAAFLLDDGAATLTAAAPATLLYRRVLRVALGAIVIGGVWGVIAMYATAWGARDVSLARSTLELVTLLSLTLSFAALASRFATDGRGGLAAGPASLGALVIVSRLPARWALMVDPSHPRWEAAGRDLAVIAFVACAALIVFSLDPARRRTVTKLRAGRTAAAGVGHIGSAGEGGG